MVPIVETEVLADGAHNLTTSRDVAEEILTWLFKALADYHVYMEGMLLRMAFVRPGHSCRRTYTHAEIARATLEVLQRRVPTSIPGKSPQELEWKLIALLRPQAAIFPH